MWEEGSKRTATRTFTFRVQFFRVPPMNLNGKEKKYRFSDNWTAILTSDYCQSFDTWEMDGNAFVWTMECPINGPCSYLDRSSTQQEMTFWQKGAFIWDISLVQWSLEMKAVAPMSQDKRQKKEARLGVTKNKEWHI